MNAGGERPDFFDAPTFGPPTPPSADAQDSTLPRRAQPAPTPVPYGEPQVFQRRHSPRAAVAGIVMVALLSAGVGGVAGITADRYLGQDTAQIPAPTQRVPHTNSTTVVQADPSNPDWEVTSAAVSPAVVAIQVNTSQGGGQGSGVIIDTDGTIVTNNHVITDDDARINVLIDSNIHPATVVGRDSSTDLAVIRLDDPPDGLRTLSFADSTELAVGQPVMAVGNPLGLSDTVTTGIISALNRPVTTRESSRGDTTNGTVVTAAIQTNAAINPGNSGGALVDTAGRLVGITSSIATMPQSEGASGNIGIGFAIPSNQVRNIADQLVATGVVRHAQLGVSARDAVAGTRLGAEVAEVVPDSAADIGGLRVGDVIIEVDGNTITNSEALVAMIRNSEVGQDVDISYMRGQQRSTATVTLGAVTQ